MNLTQGEKRIICLIANSDYRNGDLKEPVWSPCENNQDKGYLSSVSKKGLVTVDGYDKNETTVSLTDAGVEAYKQIESAI